MRTVLLSAVAVFVGMSDDFATGFGLTILVLAMIDQRVGLLIDAHREAAAA